MRKTQRNMTAEEREMLYYKNLDLKKRVLYFCPWQDGEDVMDEDNSWEVNDITVQNAIKGLYVLEQSAIAPITIIWFSYGGDWCAGMALYDFIKQIKSKITIKAYGRIRSMGTVILQAADKRILSPHCEFLIHHGSGIGHTSVQAEDMLASAEESKRTKKTMMDIYLKRIKEKNPKYTRHMLTDIMVKDCYMTPQQAVRIGLADSIIGS